MIAVGGYTAAAGGRATGISLYAWDDQRAELELLDTLATASPTWLQWHPTLPLLYAAGEVETGSLSVLSVEAGLRVLATAETGGAEPCQLAVTADGHRLFAANYGSGSVAAFELDGQGLPGHRLLVPHQGNGPDPIRQAGPHVHMIVLDQHDDLISAVDLGTDEIRSYRWTTQGLVPAAVSKLPAGCGPRQLVRQPGTDRAYVVAELTGQLLTVEESRPGSFEVIASIAGSGQPMSNLPAQFTSSADGRFGYLSNRTPNSISVFALDGTIPVRLGEYPAGDGFPRHFAVTGDWLIAANQHSDELIVFALEAGGARLREVRRYPTGSPTCVAVR